MPTYGEWEEAPEDSKVVAIHACLLHTGYVLFFHCRSYPFWTRLYQIDDNTVRSKNFVVPKWPVYYEATEETPAYPIQASKIFCSGHTFLPDGRLFVAGGELNNPYPDAFEPTAPDRGLRYAFIFDPSNPHPADYEWKIAGPSNNPHIMKEGRWYPTLTLLDTGNVLTMAGLTDSVVPNPYYVQDPDPKYIVELNKLVETYVPDTGWEIINDPDANLPQDIFYSYPDAHLIPVGEHVGKVFYASTQLVPDDFQPLPPITYHPGFSQIFDPNANSAPYWEALDNRRLTPTEASAGVLLPIRARNPEAKVVIIGGRWANNLGPFASDRVDLINLDALSPQWVSEAVKMSAGRSDPNAVLLPDRTLLVLGGDNLDGSVMNMELLDTDEMEWIDEDIPDIPVERNYHSIAILLPNGKVLVGGGRVPNGGDVEDDTERRLSLFKPKYLDDGARPEISSCPDEIFYGGTFELDMSDANSIESIALMKPGAVTHGNNMDQRYIELEFTTGGSLSTYIVTVPDKFKAPPGYYMLFVLKTKEQSTSGKSNIPSIAKFVKLSIPI